MKRSEFLSRVLVIGGLLIVLAAPLVARRVGYQGIIEMHGRMAESGGWTPAILQARVGEPLHLRLTSDDVVHGFAVGQSSLPAVDVLPGQMTDLTLQFDRPGTYTFYCTRWCGPNHWRMRGTIEVTGDEPATPASVGQPLYVGLHLDIDAPHPAAIVPPGLPLAERGAKSADLVPQKYLTLDYYRSHSPAQAYQELRADPALAALGDTDIWDVVAYLWQSKTTPEALAEAQKTYAANCSACHGESGKGDGVYATAIGALADKSPAKFADPTTMLGASPALLQGKILRGGMGTGMPSWGPILTTQQTWDIISYLYTFQFKENNP